MTDRVTGLPVVGMVGGGQLARMTHQAAIALGLSLRVLAESPTDGAALVTPDVEIGAATDAEALSRFAKSCDVVTFDHEHVPQELILELVAAGVTVHPGRRGAAVRAGQAGDAQEARVPWLAGAAVVRRPERAAPAVRREGRTWWL